MKKMNFAVSLLVYCLLVTFTSQGQEGIKVPKVVTTAFNDHFKTCDYKRWVAVKDAYVATFKQDDKWKDAYFTSDGEYKGIGKHITTDLLPLFVQDAISTKFPGYTISELYQYECMVNGLSYYAVLENAKHKVTLQLSPYGDVALLKKAKIGESQASPANLAANQ